MLAWLVIALLASPQATVWYDDLLVSSGYGRLQHERAAFLILEDDGSLTLQPWQSRGLRHASFKGTIPPRTLAIIHTHPHGESQPSSRDRAESARLGLPVIVVTTDAVIAAMPDGHVRRFGNAVAP
jgi:JAB domain-containing protein similar to deubiquitination enzymes